MIREFKDQNFIWICDTDAKSITTEARSTGEKVTINQGEYCRMGLFTSELFDNILDQLENQPKENV